MSLHEMSIISLLAMKNSELIAFNFYQYYELPFLWVLVSTSYCRFFNYSKWFHL